MPDTLTGPHLITTAPTVTRCTTCRTHMLAATVSGLDRHVDPIALTPDGELRALLAGITTYELRGRLLIRRTVDHIHAGTTGVVLAAHTCHPIPTRLIDPDRMPMAVALVQTLLGAVVITADDPPY